MCRTIQTIELPNIPRQITRGAFLGFAMFIAVSGLGIDALPCPRQWYPEGDRSNNKFCLWMSLVGPGCVKTDFGKLKRNIKSSSCAMPQH